MYVTDMAAILHYCGCGVGLELQLLFNPLAWELPYDTGVALKLKKKKKKKALLFVVRNTCDLKHIAWSRL